MEIFKEANVKGEGQVSAEDLALINALSKKELTPQEVYTFAVRLCDNELDREMERFPQETLEELAPLFVGKSGLFDHNWSATGQSARIYKTQVVHEPTLTRAGDGSCYLKGWAYMLRTEANRDLIAEIEGGIKKEVSVGCAVERRICSVCGQELGSCRHVKGRTYNGKLCWGELKGAKDAYEWSFVAVPAQRRAGVMKGCSPTLKELCRQSEHARTELAELEKSALLGRRYLEELRGETARLLGLCLDELEVETARSITRALEAEELEALKTVLARQSRERWGGGAQFSPAEGRAERTQEDGAFLI